MRHQKFCAATICGGPMLVPFMPGPPATMAGLISTSETPAPAPAWCIMFMFMPFKLLWWLWWPPPLMPPLMREPPVR